MTANTPFANIKAAFVHPFNLISLAGFGALAGALVDPTPVVTGLGLELFYLAASGFAPVDSRLHRFIYSNSFEDIRHLGHRTPIEKVSRQTVLPMLRPEIKDQYSTLEFHNNSILGTIDLASSDGAAISDSLAYLLNKFLLFAVRELEFRERLELLVKEAESLNPQHEARPHLTMVAGVDELQREEPIPSLMSRAHQGYRAEIERTLAVQTKAALQDDSDRLAIIITVLRRRSRHAERVGKALQNVRLEMNKIGVKIQSMDDGGLAAAPVQALKDLKGLIVETDSVTRTIEDIEPLEELNISLAA